jgi:hypothetical protein
MWTGALVVDRKIIGATGSDGRGCGASVRLSALVDGKPTWMPAVSVGARVVLCSGRLETVGMQAALQYTATAGGVLCDRYAFSNGHVSLVLSRGWVLEKKKEKRNE